MKNTSKLIALVLGSAFAVTSMAPAQALPMAPMKVERQAQSEIQPAAVKVKVWRGHRGYRHKRPGYRYYNGFWFPPAAFVVKVKPAKRWGNRHVRWCRNHYASYRRIDNSWKPYNGPRRKCISPYR